jgi:hypothetical protein
MFGVNPGFTEANINANVAGDLGSHGFRSTKTWGDSSCEQLSIGVDMRYIAQSTQENFLIVDPDPTPMGGFLDEDQEMFQTNQPRSVMIDPGIFAQASAPWTSFLRVTVGARLDWVHTYRAENFPFFNQGVLADYSNQQNDHLAAAFLAADIDLSCNWKARLAAGYAERVPNLVDRYSDGIYISMIQSGFSRVVGRPSLDKEQVMQIDASIRGDYEYGSLRLSAFHSWIHDYNTYAAFAVDPLTGARFLAAQNTNMATLKGFEGYTDYEATPARHLPAGKPPGPADHRRLPGRNLGRRMGLENRRRAESRRHVAKQLVRSAVLPGGGDSHRRLCDVVHQVVLQLLEEPPLHRRYRQSVRSQLRRALGQPLGRFTQSRRCARDLCADRGVRAGIHGLWRRGVELVTRSNPRSAAGR